MLEPLGPSQAIDQRLINRYKLAPCFIVRRDNGSVRSFALNEQICDDRAVIRAKS